MSDKSKALCEGCRDDYYNGKNNQGITECWLFKNAQVVQRFKIGWWTAPASREAFTEVTTLNCHNSPGNYAMEKELPIHLQGV